jgi:cytochrome c peroxidase
MISLIASIFIAKSFAMQALPLKPEFPKDNPQTVQKIELGKMLFMDPRLSIDGTISCNSCHNVMAGGDDDRATSVGIKGQVGGRSAPTVWNSAYHTVQFWDGRAASLEEQAKGPLTNPIEMGMPSHDAVVQRIKTYPEYVVLFTKAFGKDGINIDNYAKAVAAFERTLITPNSRFDKYMRGNKKALSQLEIKGMKLVDEIGCTACHSGANFNGEGLKMGEGNFQKFPVIENKEIEKKYAFMKDKGRYEVTKKDDDMHMFRVPTWRNIAHTAPYFHNGAVKTLDEAVKVMAKLQLDKDLKEDEVQAIVAFLNSLTGEFPKIIAPRIPELVGRSTVD